MSPWSLRGIVVALVMLQVPSLLSVCHAQEKIDPVNDMPWAAHDAYETNEGTELVVPAPGILANDSDPDGDALTAALAQAPAHGNVVLNADGSFTYTPAPDFQGADGFTYTASDGKGGSDNASVTIAVDPVGDGSVDDGSIGVYFDAAGTRCQGTIHTGAPGIVYILAKPGTTAGVAGAEFRFTGLPLSWHVFPVANPELFTMGDPFGDGVVAAWQCQGSPKSAVLLYSVTVLADAEEPDVVLGIEHRDPPSNYSFPCPLLVACDNPAFTKHCVASQSCFVNSSTSAGPCANVLEVDQKTWTGVKELYR